MKRETRVYYILVVLTLLSACRLRLTTVGIRT
jgi:hypothetical protein